MLYNIQNFDDFVRHLLSAGFSLGGSADGIFSLVPWSWNEPAPYDTPVKWHTGEPETDPWEWRMRVLEERSDIAYGKVFLRKSGFITREYYPLFLAVRRGKRSFDQTYADGEMRHECKRIYDVLRQQGALPLELLKAEAGFTKESKNAFDRALQDLQMKLYVTLCGRNQRFFADGKEGWASTVLTTTEAFWGQEVFAEAAELTPEEAEARLFSRISALNPDADAKKARKFIRG